MKKLDLLGMIPGVKEKREADILKEFGEDSSSEEAGKIRDLTRRSFLKMGGTFLAALGTGAAIYGVDKQMDVYNKRFKTKAWNAMIKLIYEGSSPNASVRSRKYLDGDGNIQVLSEATEGIRGFLQHLSLTNGSINVDGEEVKYEILTDQIRINLFSDEEQVGKPIIGEDSVMITEDYLDKHNIDTIVREFPFKLTHRGKEVVFKHTKDYKISRLPKAEEEHMKKMIGDKIVMNQHDGKIEDLPKEVLIEILNFSGNRQETLSISNTQPFIDGITSTMSDEVLVLSATNHKEGELNGRNFKVKDMYAITSYDLSGKIITQWSLIGGIMISKKQLQESGVVKIKLEINLEVDLGEGSNATVFGQQVIDLRSAKFVKIDEPFKIERPNGSVIIQQQ